MKKEMDERVQSVLDNLKRRYDEVLRYENEKNKLERLKDCLTDKLPIFTWGGIKGATDIIHERVCRSPVCLGGELGELGELDGFQQKPSEETEVLLPQFEDTTETELLLNCLIEIFDRRIVLTTYEKELAMTELRKLGVDYEITVNSIDDNDFMVSKDGLKNGFCDKYCVVTYKGRKEARKGQ